MNRTAKIIITVALSFAVLLCLTPGAANAQPPTTWVPGTEYELLGHRFTDEYWTNGNITVPAEDNVTIQFLMSYVNYNGQFHAGLLAMGNVANGSGTLATLPYQLFGMHYTTTGGQDIFVGAVFAFLFGYNDTNGNLIPDPSIVEETPFFVVPYGYFDPNKNITGDPPVAEAIPITKHGTGHYEFGVRYRNLYARIVSGKNDILEFLLTLTYPLIEVQFSELEVRYDIQINDTTGEVTAETFYTIGQIQQLSVLGVPIPDPQPYLENISIGAAHYVVCLTSYYEVEEGSYDPAPAADWLVTNITTDALGRERAFALGVRGTYELKNESTGLPYGSVASGLPAISWLLQPKLSDLVLIAWQLPLSAYVFGLFTYATSPYLRSQYPTLGDFYANATNELGGYAFWYGIAFPNFQGWRVEHDPVYTIYSNIGQVTPTPGIPGFPFEAIAVAIGAAVTVGLVRRRRKR